VRDKCLQPVLIDKVRAIEQAVDIDYLSGEIPRAIDQSLRGWRGYQDCPGDERVALFGERCEETRTDLNKAIETTCYGSASRMVVRGRVVTAFDQAYRLSAVCPAKSTRCC